MIYVYVYNIHRSVPSSSSSSRLLFAYLTPPVPPSDLTPSYTPNPLIGCVLLTVSDSTTTNNNSNSNKSSSSKDRGSVAEVRHLSVSQAYRRLGIGRILMTKVR